MKKTKTITTEVSSLNSFVCTIFICLLFSSALSNTLLLFTLNSSNSLSFHDIFFFSYQDWSLHSGSIDWAIGKKKKKNHLYNFSCVFIHMLGKKKSQKFPLSYQHSPLSQKQHHNIKFPKKWLSWSASPLCHPLLNCYLFSYSRKHSQKQVIFCNLFTQHPANQTVLCP